jgi:hypothetical protein
LLSDNVEKLSISVVDIWVTVAELWMMRKTYPPKLWKTKRSLEACGGCGKLINYLCGKLSWLYNPFQKAPSWKRGDE